MKRRNVLSALCAITAAVLLLGSCQKPSAGEDSTAAEVSTAPEETTAAEETGDLVLMDESKSVFAIVRGDRASDTQISAAVYLNSLVKERLGVTLEIRDDFILPTKPYDPLTKEVLVGSTNREESVALEARLEKGQFAIVTSSTKIVIVASRDSLIKMAVEYFFNNFVTTAENGKLCVERDVEYFSEAGLSNLDNVLTVSKLLTSDAEEVLNIPAPSSTMKTPQGGTFDGTYYYQLFIQRDYDNNEQNNVDRIVKVDMKTGKIVKTSGDLALNHGNDITYNPKTNQLAVVHNNPNRTHVTLIDPDTLEVIQTVRVPMNIYCMDYDETHDLYVVGLSGGQSFCFLNPDFTLNSRTFTPTPSTNGYTTQGMSCDKDFIYFVLYNQNVITVYDWNGKFVTVVQLNVGAIEPENIAVVDGEIFVGCAKAGATVFRITPKEIE